jgi:cutinase
MHTAIPKLAPQVQNQIAAVVLFGDTKNKQSNHMIKGFPTDKLEIFCNAGDKVCFGSLTITEAHRQYTPNVAAAEQFLEAHIKAARKQIGNV